MTTCNCGHFPGFALFQQGPLPCPLLRLCLVAEAGSVSAAHTASPTPPFVSVSHPVLLAASPPVNSTLLLSFASATEL